MKVFVSKAGRETGPFTKEQVASMFEAGMIGGDDHAWHEGMSEWTSVGVFLQLRPSPPKATGAVPEAPRKIRYRKPGEKTFQRPEPLPGRGASYVIPDLKDRSGQFAWFGIRLVALLVDAAVLLVTFFIIRLVTGDELVGAFFSVPSPNEGGDGLLLVAAILSIPGWLYYGLLESSEKQASFGKQICGLVVTNSEGRRLSFGQASVRYFAKFLSSCAFGIGFLMCIWTERKQCLHDMIASCFVLKK